MSSCLGEYATSTDSTFAAFVAVAEGPGFRVAAFRRTGAAAVADTITAASVLRILAIGNEYPPQKMLSTILPEL